MRNTRKGVFNQTTLDKYQPAVLELASAAGSMRDLAAAMDVHLPRLCEWARGEKIPDFEKLVAQGRYSKASAYVFAFTGKTLAQLFRPELASEEPQPLQLDVCNCDSHGQSPEDALIARADLGRIFRQLDLRDRMVLARASDGWTITEQAEALGKSRPWADFLLRRARRRAIKLLPVEYRQPYCAVVHKSV